MLPSTLAALSARHAEIDLEMSEMRTGPQLTALAESRLDVAMVYGKPPATGLRSRHLLRVPLVAVVGLRHHWARRDRVPFADFAWATAYIHKQAQTTP